MQHKGEYHYYGTSSAEWKTSDDLREVIAHFEKSHFPYALYYVPVPQESDYQIKFYAPQVEGTFCIGEFFPAKAEERKAFGWSKKAA